MLAIGALLITGPRLGAPDHHHGVMLGAAAGVLFGVSDVAIKALTGLDGPLADPRLAVAGRHDHSPRSSPSTPPPAACRTARPSRSSPRPPPPPTSPASSAASSSSATRCRATRSASPSRRSPSCSSSSPRSSRRRRCARPKRTRSPHCYGRSLQHHAARPAQGRPTSARARSRSASRGAPPAACAAHAAPGANRSAAGRDRPTRPSSGRRTAATTSSGTCAAAARTRVRQRTCGPTGRPPRPAAPRACDEMREVHGPRHAPRSRARRRPATRRRTTRVSASAPRGRSGPHGRWRSRSGRRAQADAHPAPRGELERQAAAHRVARHVRASSPSASAKRRELVGHPVDGLRAGRRLAEAREVDGDHVVVAREQRHHGPPHLPCTSRGHGGAAAAGRSRYGRGRASRERSDCADSRPQLCCTNRRMTLDVL